MTTIERTSNADQSQRIWHLQLDIHAPGNTIEDAATEAVRQLISLAQGLNPSFFLDAPERFLDIKNETGIHPIGWRHPDGSVHQYRPSPPGTRILPVKARRAEGPGYGLRTVAMVAIPAKALPDLQEMTVTYRGDGPSDCPVTVIEPAEAIYSSANCWSSRFHFEGLQHIPGACLWIPEPGVYLTHEGRWKPLEEVNGAYDHS